MMYLSSDQIMAARFIKDLFIALNSFIMCFLGSSDICRFFLFAISKADIGVWQVRKRPLNKKEVARKEDDIVTVSENDCLTVHEPKLKV